MGGFLKCCSTKCCFEKYPDITIGFTILVTVAFVSSILLTMKQSDSILKRYSNTDYPVTLIIQGLNNSFIFDTDQKLVQPFLAPIKNATAFEIYGSMEKTFYGIRHSSTIVYISHEKGKENGTDPVILLQESKLTPRSIAYDYIGNNLYVTDYSAGTLVVINVETKLCSILIGTLTKPHQVEVDPYRGFIFILQHVDTHPILRSNMDGTGILTLINNKVIRVITIDHKSARVYWDCNYIIESCNYEGNERIILSFKKKYSIGLAVMNNKVFRLVYNGSHEPPSDENQSKISHIGSHELPSYDNEVELSHIGSHELPSDENESEISHILTSCIIHNGVCENKTEHKVNFLGDYGSMKAYYTSTEQKHSTAHPCQKENGGCQHICLIAPEGEYTCVCKLGWQLESNNKTCIEVEEFLLHSSRSYFRGRTLSSNQNISVDVIWPISFDADFVNFDYDPENDKLYYTTGGTEILEGKLKTNRFDPVTVLTDKENIADVAYDLITSNLYYLQIEQKYNYKFKIFNVKLGSNYNKTLTSVENHSFPNLIGSGESFKELVDIPVYFIIYNYFTISPDSGHLFFCYENEESHTLLCTVTTNAAEILENKCQLLSNRSQRANVAVDYVEQRIYWLSGGEYIVVNHATFDISDEKNFSIPLSIHQMRLVVEIKIHRNWLYLRTRHSIWHVNKLTGNDLENIQIRNIFEESWVSYLRGMEVVSRTLEISSISRENPCKKENGGCEQFCFVAHSKAVCNCRDEEKLVNAHCNKGY